MMTWQHAYEHATKVARRDSIRMLVRGERNLTGSWVYWPEKVR